MAAVRRRSIGTGFSVAIQPAFIIGTVNEDGSDNFAPITWVSATCEKSDDYLLVISMFGSKMTKLNVLRNGMLSVNLVSRDMLPLMDYFGTRHAKDGKKDAMEYSVSRGLKADVPVLDASRWVYECKAVKAFETGESTTFFCRILNVQCDENAVPEDTFDVDLTRLDPVIYSGRYHSIGEFLGRIGDFS
ncbi:MAG: DUF447 family protein [Clostridia bacterium]|nr:DUF447 family protein [Clostridia bacterium]